MGIYSAEAAMAYKDNVYNPDAAGLLEFALESQRAEHAMFETMLEMDFVEYRMSNNDMIVTEADKGAGFGAAIKGVWNKIVEAIEKAIETVSAFLKRLGEFVLEKTKADKLFVKKYSKDFDIAKAAANDPKKEITFIKVKDAAKAVQGVINLFNVSYGDALVLQSGQTGKDLSGESDRIKKDVSNLAKAKFEDSVKFESAGFKAKAEEIKKAIEGGNGYKAIADEIVGDKATGVLDALKKCREEIKKNMKKNNGEEKEDYTARRASLTECYRFISLMNSLCNKTLNIGSRIALQAMASYRKAYAAIAIAAAKKTEEKAETDSNSNSNIDEQNKRYEEKMKGVNATIAKGKENRISQKARENINKSHRDGYKEKNVSSYDDIYEFALMYMTDNTFDVSFG